MLTRAAPIAISAVDIPAEAEALVLAALRSGAIAQGPLVRQFEQDFASAIGARHAVAVNNGTTALVAALEVLDLQPGDEVVTTPFTFVATLNAIIEAGATARFADISADDFCLRPDALRGCLGPRTRAVMPVHLYGQCADLPAIATIAEEAGAALVEDAAQAHGATVAGRAAGTWGIGCFSLYATKNITTGEGGLITTDDDAVADRLRILRNQGMRARYEYEEPGHNYRMTDLQAAVGIPQVAHLAEIIEIRQRNARRLTEGLAGCAALRLPSVQPGRDHVWHQYTVLIEEGSPLDRDDLARALDLHGIASGVYYPRVVFDYDCYRDHPQVEGTLEEVPVAAGIARRTLSLPVHARLSSDDLDRVVATVRSLLG